VQLRREGLVLEEDRSDAPCSARHPEPLPDPQCTLAAVWQHALAKGIPANHMARIEYYRSRQGPAYRFELVEGGESFVLYGDCKRELKGHESSGKVP
jgi:hypothetical protein